MSLRSLLDQARARVTTQPRATDAVVHSRYDAMIHGELLTEAPELQRLADDLNRKYPHTDDLVRDTLMQFFQDSPRLRSQQEMDPSRLLNWTVSQSLAAAPETAEIRPRTRHDKYGAAMATLGVTKQVKRYLGEHQEVLEAAAEAERAQQELAAAEQELQQASGRAEAAAQGLDEYQGEGPLTEAQTEAQERAESAGAQLAEAMAAAEAAGLSEQAAADAATGVAAVASQQLREPIRDAIRQAGDDLRREAEMMFAWGVQPGEATMMSIDQRAALARSLRDQDMSKFMSLLGRFKLQQAALRATRVEFGRDEMYAVEMSGRLQDVVATEFALARSHRILRLDFLRRYAAGQLLSRAYRGIERVGKGAIICLVDTSSSMHEIDKDGIPRGVWAKAFALAMLERARADHRDFVGIIFASAGQQQVFHFPGGRGNIDDVLAFACKDFNGGTNFEKPLDLATDVLEAEFNGTGRRKGDVVFITDDDCKVSTQWMKQYLARKSNLGFRVFGIAVGMPAAGGVLTALSDNVRAVSSFADPVSVADIMTVV